MTLINSQQLKTIINEKNWDQFLQDVKPEYFVRQESETMLDANILAQLCQIQYMYDAPDSVTILSLKCLVNSCLDGYKYKQHVKDHHLFSISVNCGKNLYNELIENCLCKQGKNCDYPHDTRFPYEGVIDSTARFIKIFGFMSQRHKINITSLDVVRLNIRFLCNVFTYACPDTSADSEIMRFLDCDELKQAILSCMQSDNKPLVSAACIYVHNALKKLCDDYFTTMETELYVQLLKPAKEGFTSAKDALLLLLHRPDALENIYNDIKMSEKLDLLEFIYNEIWKCSDINTVLPKDQAEYLALTFSEKCDLILETMVTYVNSVESTEIIFILNILGLLTMQHMISENAECLLIKCESLLRSLHMAGKEADNYFTPIRNLSMVAPSAQRRTVNVCSNTDDIKMSEPTAASCDPQEHPAFGFKAGLIRVIANLVYQNKKYQDVFREIDGIPLLLDCCNIDARNPLILQWTILALRNLCEGNTKNQEFIKSCEKTGVSDNLELQMMGLTLHEDADGKSIGIAPLRRN